MRCETEIEPFNTVVVMFTLRETVSDGYAHFARQVS